MVSIQRRLEQKDVPSASFCLSLRWVLSFRCSRVPVRQADYAMVDGYMLGAGTEEDRFYWARCFVKPPL